MLKERDVGWIEVLLCWRRKFARLMRRKWLLIELEQVLGGFCVFEMFLLCWFCSTKRVLKGNWSRKD